MMNPLSQNFLAGGSMMRPTCVLPMRPGGIGLLPTQGQMIRPMGLTNIAMPGVQGLTAMSPQMMFLDQQSILQHQQIIQHQQQAQQQQMLPLSMNAAGLPIYANAMMVRGPKLIIDSKFPKFEFFIFSYKEVTGLSKWGRKGYKMLLQLRTSWRLLRITAPSSPPNHPGLSLVANQLHSFSPRKWWLLVAQLLLHLPPTHYREMGRSRVTCKTSASLPPPPTHSRARVRFPLRLIATRPIRNSDKNTHASLDCIFWQTVQIGATPLFTNFFHSPVFSLFLKFRFN